MIAVAPMSAARFASSTAAMPFQAEGAVPLLADRLGALPVEALVEHRGEIFGDRLGHARPFGHMRREVRQAEFFAEDVVEAPAGLGGVAQHIRCGEARRRGEARAEAAFAVAADDRIDGERDGIEFRVARGVEHRLVEALVVVDIELEQLGAIGERTGLGEADRREARYARDGARVRRGAEDGALALPVEEALERGRREEERHRDLAAEERRLHVDAFDPGEHARDQVAVVECRAVAAARDLVIGGAVDIVEHRPGQAALRERAEVVDIVAVGEFHACPIPRHCERSEAIQSGLRNSGLLRYARNDEFRRRFLPPPCPWSRS
jgi:hypothetical protein